MEENELKQPLFRDLHGDDTDPEITEIESLCLQCKENGITRILLTKIPFYKEVVIMSFRCEHCDWENNELQPAAKIQEQGVVYCLKVNSAKDMARQVVRTNSASIQIPEIQFEIPANTQEAAITTVEGVIERAVNGITTKYNDIKVEDPETSEKLLVFLGRLKELCEVPRPFTFILEDPSGNSFLENFCAPQKDPALEVSHYKRTYEQDRSLGIFYENHNEDLTEDDKLQEEVLEFSTNCPACNAPCQTNMKLTKIPNFKEVVIMATTCDSCGHRTNEVKSGSGMEPKGQRIKLEITEITDLNRDLLKSETCDILIPDLELEVGGRMLGGRFTTVEGILTNIKELLQENPLFAGDSTREDIKIRMDKFLDKLNEVIEGTRKVTLILDDPCGNSYLQSMCASDPDPHLEITAYERTFEQNEELGINDMKTENYTS